MTIRIKALLRCCQSPNLTEVRRLWSAYRKEVGVETCRSCGAHWIHDDSETAISGDWEEVQFDAYARLSPEEAASLPAEPTDADLAFLAERDWLVTEIGGRPVWRKGWPDGWPRRWPM